MKKFERKGKRFVLGLGDDEVIGGYPDYLTTLSDLSNRISSG